MHRARCWQANVLIQTFEKGSLATGFMIRRSGGLQIPLWKLCKAWKDDLSKDIPRPHYLEACFEKASQTTLSWSLLWKSFQKENGPLPVGIIVWCFFNEGTWVGIPCDRFQDTVVWWTANPFGKLYKARTDLWSQIEAKQKWTQWCVMQAST